MDSSDDKVFPRGFAGVTQIGCEQHVVAEDRKKLFPGDIEFCLNYREILYFTLMEQLMQKFEAFDIYCYLVVFAPCHSRNVSSVAVCKALIEAEMSPSLCQG